MEAVRAVQTVKEGHILLRLPKQFWGRQVEIIVLAAPQEIDSPQATAEKSLRGCLRQYADPALAALEQNAWQEAAQEKHDAD